MPNVQEVFRMSTQKVRPEPGFLDRQIAHQRRAARNRKAGAIAVVIALVMGLIAFAVVERDDERLIPGGNGGASLEQPTRLPRSVASGPLDAGSYTTGSFDPAVTFAVGDDDWWVGWDWGDGIDFANGTLSIERPLPDGGFVRISFWDSTTAPFFYEDGRGPAPHDFVAYIQQQGPAQVHNLLAGDVELDGLLATRLEFEVGPSYPDFHIQLPGVSPNAAAFVWGDLESQHWVVVETDDDQLLINYTVEEAIESPETLAIADGYFADVIETVKLAERA